MGRRELVPYLHNGIMHKLRRSIRHFHAAHAASLKATHSELWQAEIGHLAATIFSITRNGVFGRSLCASAAGCVEGHCTYGPLGPFGAGVPW